ncbi:hypothetical protein JMJ35_010125 [Cladonia borealis]|uniref:Ankyrin repeat protein n=1 Tax=Cladonia borealis TaxID=184061 RepID=A0AA39QR18_9LECA|nr:hypothetical protein JMJ35_010125 [Cladonia borealis]
MEGPAGPEISRSFISDSHDKCFRSFTALTTAIRHPVRDFGDQIPPWEVMNEFDRYKIWAGNVGAMHKGRQYQISLDYRLSEAAFYRQQVLSFLKTLDLNVSMSFQKWRRTLRFFENPADAISLELVQGRRKPAEEDVAVGFDHEENSEDSSEVDSDLGFEDSPWEISDSEGHDDTAPELARSTHQAISPGARKPTLETPHTLAEINFTITCLYKLPLRDPAPLDRYVGKALADMSIYEHFDILYVKDKFKLANPTLVTRLGKLVTRRRQLLASRSAHDQRLMPEDVEPKEDFSDTNTNPDLLEIPRDENVQKSVEVNITKTTQSQFSGSRRTGMTKASILRENVRGNVRENASEYAPSMASSYAAELRVKVPDRPRDKHGEELKDFKCPYCFVACHVESRDRWKKHVLRDIRPYVCTFQGCELYEYMFEKRDEWFQHELQSHRVEWRCGQESHPQYGDQAAFLAHMSDCHNATVDAAQSAVFLGMFERPKQTQTGNCCLCLREAKNLGTHLAHHLEQIALFALPRESEIPEMNSRFNVRGSIETLSKEKTSLDSRSEKTQSQNETFLQDGIDILGKDDNNEEVDAVDQVKVPEPEMSDAGFSWAEVYQKIGTFDTKGDQNQLEVFAVSSEAAEKTQHDQHEKIRRWLHPPDPSLNYNKALKERFARTGTWFIDSPVFISWKTTPGSFLWLYGIPGCGKSILSSTIIEAVFDYCSPNLTLAVLYFYFDFSSVEKQQHENMIRSLIIQLSSQCASTPQVLESLYSSYANGERQPTYNSLLATLHQMMGSFEGTYLVIDALDECIERQELLASIEELTSWKDANLHILTTSRMEKDIEDSIEPFNNHQGKIYIQSTLVNDDIRAYVHGRLRTDQWLKRWRPEIQQEIEKALMEKADGMFRWAACQLDSLRSCLNVYGVRKALRSLPITLDDTYTRILLSINEAYFQYVFKILQWLTYSARPLELKELAEVVAIDLDESPRFDPERRFPEPQDILVLCSSLISWGNKTLKDIYSESNKTIVKFAHLSIREYLVSERILQGSANHYSIQEINASTSISNDCLAYLLELSRLQPSTSQFLAEMPLAEYAAKYWTQHAQVVERETSYIPLLTTELFLSGDALLNWIRLYDPDKPWKGPDLERSSSSICPPLYYASMAGLSKSVQMLLDKGADVNAQGGNLVNALQAASTGGHNQVVQILLDKGADVNAFGGRYGNALQVASSRGHNQVVQILLDKGADVNAQGGHYSNALRAASEGGHEKVVQMLLDSGADINAKGGDSGNALQAASKGGHDQVVQMLLNSGADINAQSGMYSNALQAASHRGHEKVVQMLLDRGADINAQGGVYNNALQAASEGGHDQVVQILLDNGADINAQGGIYSTALQMASQGGHEKVVQLLLDSGADIDAQGGHEKVVQRLLDSGADIDAQGGICGTALQIASQGGHEKVVQILLDNGADINARGDVYDRTALQAASEGGHEKLVQMLLDRGADIDGKGGKSGNALQAR